VAFNPAKKAACLTVSTGNRTEACALMLVCWVMRHVAVGFTRHLFGSSFALFFCLTKDEHKHEQLNRRQFLNPGCTRTYEISHGRGNRTSKPKRQSPNFSTDHKSNKFYNTTLIPHTVMLFNYVVSMLNKFTFSLQEVVWF